MDSGAEDEYLLQTFTNLSLEKNVVKQDGHIYFIWQVVFCMDKIVFS